MKSLKTKVSLLSFGSAATAQPQRETIATPFGAIYGGTPEAEQYLAIKAYQEPLAVLASALRSRQYGAAEACAEITKILPVIPALASGVTETLLKLSAGLGAGPVAPADAPVDWLVRDLEQYVKNAENGMSGVVARAPKPPDPNAVAPVQSQRPGTGSRWAN